jgi:hypothetical protein
MTNVVDPGDNRSSQVRFIEDKPADWRLVEDTMRLSARAGRYANFGPVQYQLADVVAKMLGLGADRVVVPASSATTSCQHRHRPALIPDVVVNVAKPALSQDIGRQHGLQQIEHLIDEAAQRAPLL